MWKKICKIFIALVAFILLALIGLRAYSYYYPQVYIEPKLIFLNKKVDIPPKGYKIYSATHVGGFCVYGCPNGTYILYSDGTFLFETLDSYTYHLGTVDTTTMKNILTELNKTSIEKLNDLVKPAHDESYCQGSNDLGTITTRLFIDNKEFNYTDCYTKLSTYPKILTLIAQATNDYDIDYDIEEGGFKRLSIF